MASALRMRSIFEFSFACSSKIKSTLPLSWVISFWSSEIETDLSESTNLSNDRAKKRAPNEKILDFMVNFYGGGMSCAKCKLHGRQL